MAVGGTRLCGLALCAALVLWSADASAVLIPVCASVDARAMPAPIEPGDIAIFLKPNSDGGAFAVVWRDAEGRDVPFEVFEPEGSGRIYLRPQVLVEAGSYTLVYSDQCKPDPSGPVAPPVELPLLFVSAPPPPPPDQLGELLVHYEAYCFGEQNSLGYTDFPPLVRVSLVPGPDIEPYLPFMHVVLRDDTGLIDYEVWNAAPGVTVSAHSRCGSYSPTLQTGTRTFTLEAEIIEGARYDAVSAVAEIECAQCDDALSGGASGKQAPLADAGRDPAAHSSGCGVASSRAAAQPPWLLAMLLVVATLYGRRREVELRWL